MARDGSPSHYRAPDIARLREAVRAICDDRRGTVLRAARYSGAKLGQNAPQNVVVGSSTAKLLIQRSDLVEPVGIEPTTSTMPLLRSPS